MLEVDAYSALLKNVNAVYEKVGIPSAILQEHSDWENDKASRFETMKEYDAWLDTNYPRSPIGTYLYHLPKEEKMDILETISVNKAQGGRIGYQGGGTPIDLSTPEGEAYLREHNPGLTYESNDTPPWSLEGSADTSGILSQVSPYAEGNKLANDAIDKIFIEFRERFPEASDEDIQQMVRNEIANMQADAVAATPGLGILGFKESMDMITPESVDTSSQAISRHLWEGDDSRHTAREKRIGKQLGGRPGYGLGSLVKGVFKGVKKGVKGLTKSIKKFAKSDLGKMALMYMATAGMANIGAGGWAGAQPWSKGAWLKPSNVLGLGKTGWGNIGKSFTNLGFGGDKLKSGQTLYKKIGVDPKALIREGTEKFLYSPVSSNPASLVSKFGQSFTKNPFPWIAGTAGLAGLYTAANPGKDNIDELMRNYKGEVGEWDQMLADIRAGQGVTPFATDNVLFPYPNYYQLAGGGRVAAQEGGLMDLGGMEKDYRAEGGFVPIGGKEKADDVPARLSRNEFVFTADAVRNAGGGDVDRGAEVMENVMTNLENGGSISEESQGLEGARDMFEVSERLSEVV